MRKFVTILFFCAVFSTVLNAQMKTNDLSSLQQKDPVWHDVTVYMKWKKVKSPYKVLHKEEYARPEKLNDLIMEKLIISCAEVKGNGIVIDDDKKKEKIQIHYIKVLDENKDNWQHLKFLSKEEFNERCHEMVQEIELARIPEEKDLDQHLIRLAAVLECSAIAVNESEKDQRQGTALLLKQKQCD